tara:strand:+ start:2232 stop:2909 length:678 start_codon:yes stop_codon:yes gene_type:complete
MNFKNFALVGASSEVAIEFSKLLHKKKLNQILVTSNKNLRSENINSLLVKDYLDEVREIGDFLKDYDNLVVIFFNGYLAENRDLKIPTYEEIKKTQEINFLVPYFLTSILKNNLPHKTKFIFMSSMAATKLRYKNYIYGMTKRNLENSIKKLNLQDYLIFRFGKITTKMSEGHKNPPFMVSAEEASRIIFSNLNKKKIFYPRIGLKIIAGVLKITPQKLIDFLKY